MVGIDADGTGADAEGGADAGDSGAYTGDGDADAWGADVTACLFVEGSRQYSCKWHD